MQRYGQIVLDLLVGESPDSRNQSAGWDRDVSGPDPQAKVMIDRPAEIEHVIIVVKRLTNAHYHDVRYPDVIGHYVLLDFQYL